MPWKIYRSTDSGALTLDGTAGSLISVFNDVLAKAGWSRPFAGSSTKMVYRAGSGTSAYFRILDDGSLGIGAKGAAIRGYMAMSDIDTGTDPFPTVAQATNGRQIGKSENSNATAVPWIIAADSRTVVMFTYLASAAKYQLHYFGDIFSFTSGDAYHAVVMCPSTASAVDGWTTQTALDFDTTWQTTTQDIASLNSTPQVCSDFSTTRSVFIARTYTQTGASVTFQPLVSTNISRESLGNRWGWYMPKRNPVDNGVYLTDIFCAQSVRSIRGKLRGIKAMCHHPNTWSTGEQFDGEGRLLGRRFEVFRMYSDNGAYTASESRSLLALEISDTAD